LTEKKYRVVHYLNQFYGQVGGEAEATHTPFIKEGPIGPGMALKGVLGNQGEIVATVICGDSYFADNLETARDECLSLIKQYNPDVVIAGPAFNAGRYGMACGAVCTGVIDELHLPAVTAMFPENPGVEIYHKKVYILPTSNSASSMRAVVPKLGTFALKLASGRAIGFPEEEGYLPQGYRINVFAEKIGAERAIEMLLAKLGQKPFKTELPIPVFDRVDPAPAVKDLRKAVIALVTSGGIVPKGNPDRIESHDASKFCRYDISQINDLIGDEYESIHGGYDIVYANEDPDRILPLDVTRQLEEEGIIGKLYDFYYVTVGNTTAVSSAVRYGDEIGKELEAAGVDGVLLTST